MLIKLPAEKLYSSMDDVKVLLYCLFILVLFLIYLR